MKDFLNCDSVVIYNRHTGKIEQKDVKIKTLESTHGNICLHLNNLSVIVKANATFGYSTAFIIATDIVSLCGELWKH